VVVKEIRERFKIAERLLAAHRMNPRISTNLPNMALTRQTLFWSGAGISPFGRAISFLVSGALSVILVST